MRFISLLLLLIFSSCLPEPDIIVGKVIKVADGDTLTILTEENEQVKIRLSGIDCPEKNQDFGQKARKFTNNFCYNKTVQVENKGTDLYGRTLGIVEINGKNLNEELLKNGLAWHYKDYNSSLKYAGLELNARMEQINIWSTDYPVAPWEFRRTKHE